MLYDLTAKLSNSVVQNRQARESLKLGSQCIQDGAEYCLAVRVTDWKEHLIVVLEPFTVNRGKYPRTVPSLSSLLRLNIGTSPLWANTNLRERFDKKSRKLVVRARHVHHNKRFLKEEACRIDDSFETHLMPQSSRSNGCTFASSVFPSVPYRM